jgi:hypothetical protein
MKIKRHFIYTVGNVKVSRTYGGSDYTVTVYENKGRGKLVRLGERTACTRGHKGEASEAWSVVMQALPRLCKALAKLPDAEREQYTYYYHYTMCERLGISLQQI